MAMVFEQQTLPTILCCMCGVAMPSNPSNMCVNCIRGQVDITEGIPKQVSIYWCRNCGRYLQPPTNWLSCQLESPELLRFCVKKIKGLTKVRLIDAGFVWTEPHSRRLKVKLTVQKEIFASTILQQVFVVEFVVNNQMCQKCQRAEAKDTWNAVVQLRQKVTHKRTFFFLEQLILKHNAHVNTLNIKDQPDGLDFFFTHKSHALKFIDFLQSTVPIKFNSSSQLVSHDEHSNTYNYKYTFAVDIVPLCRDDLVCLPVKTANAMGFASPLILVHRVSSVIKLLDPLTLVTNEMHAVGYWKAPFRAVRAAAQAVEYTVLDVTPVGPTRGKMILADVQLARSSDLGVNDIQFHARTHIGQLLDAGDLVMGYDMANAIYNDEDMKSMKGRSLPDVIIVKKVQPHRSRAEKRIWRLKRLEVEDNEGNRKNQDAAKNAKDYEEFLQELEESKDLRSGIHLYKDPKLAAKAVASAPPPPTSDAMEDEDDGPAFEDVTIDELIDDMDDLEVAEDEDGDQDME